MEYVQQMVAEKVMGSFMGGGGESGGSSSNLQQDISGMNPDQIKGYLHTATTLMESASGSSMVSQSAYSGWVSQANGILQALDSHVGGGGPTNVEDLKSQAQEQGDSNPDFQQGQQLAQQHHGATFGMGSGTGDAMGGGDGY